MCYSRYITLHTQQGVSVIQPSRDILCFARAAIIAFFGLELQALTDTDDTLDHHTIPGKCSRPVHSSTGREWWGSLHQRFCRSFCVRPYSEQPNEVMLAWVYRRPETPKKVGDERMAFSFELNRRGVQAAIILHI